MQRRNGQEQPHPEYIEAMEISMDRLLPEQTPVLIFHGQAKDPRRILATVPSLALGSLYLGRLVSVEIGDDGLRRGSIEAIDGTLALVRYVDWDD